MHDSMNSSQNMGFTKESKDPTRAERKLKKRKLEEAVFDLPDDLCTPALRDPPIPAKGREGTSKKRRVVEDSASSTHLQQKEESKLQRKEKDGKSDGKGGKKKSQSPDEERAMLDHNMSGDSVSLIGQDPPAKKSKKERKAERKAAEAVKAAASNNSILSSVGDIAVADGEIVQPRKPKKNNRNREKRRKGDNINETLQEAEGTLPRFIVFIGNLPFSATTESIKKHFAAIHPKSIRHLTRKDEPQKSKGCAFLEFERYDHMKACLKSYHHSIFDDGVSAARKINVELTAGGGGNKINRHSKIQEKNQKLNDQRTRRKHEEEKAKLGRKDSVIDHGDIHPSRRTRVLDIQ